MRFLIALLCVLTFATIADAKTVVVGGGNNPNAPRTVQNNGYNNGYRPGYNSGYVDPRFNTIPYDTCECFAHNSYYNTWNFIGFVNKYVYVYDRYSRFSRPHYNPYANCYNLARNLNRGYATNVEIHQCN